MQTIEQGVAKAKIELEKALKQALEKGCLIVERDAKMNAPAVTGNLRNSITHQIDSLTGYIGTNVEYAPYVEIGTGIYSSMGDGRQGGWAYYDAQGIKHFTMGSRPHPFLKPALDGNKSAIEKCFERIL